MSTIGRHIETARNILIYGLSLSALDAELATVLSTSLMRNKGGGQVVIMDLKVQLPALQRKARSLAPANWDIVCEDVS